MHITIEMSPQFHIINAAAGSGKTFNLVFYYLKRLLRSQEIAPYRQFLALTFTNKAVDELKTRILKTLYHLAFETHQETVLLNLLVQDLKRPQEQISQHAEKMLRKLFQEYAAFDVLTLDKFTHRIIRIFAKDFKLPYGFDVAVDADQMLMEMVNTMIEAVGKDPVITAVLCAFSLDKIKAQKSWDISNDLFRFSKQLLNENAGEPLKLLRSKSTSGLQEDQKALKGLMASMKKEYMAIAADMLELLHKSGLGERDFSRGIFYKYLKAMADGAVADASKPHIYQALLGEKPLYNKTLDEGQKNKIEVLRQELLQHYEAMKSKAGGYAMAEALLKNWTPIALLHIMERTLEKLQLEQQRLLLARFNARIAKVIAGQPAPFIYERMGERYRHYFIDEFQDTSGLQWENLIPLIANALETEEVKGESGSLFLVGDPKQAIYRWRGGNVQQFMALLNKQSPFQIKAPYVQPLERNYRSRDEVVRFNNAFFKYAGTHFSDAGLQKLFCESSQQKTHDKPGGSVQLEFVPASRKKAEAYPYYIEKTVKAIHCCLENYYRPKDMVILVRNNKKAATIAEGLVLAGIKIVTSESLVLSQSKSVQFFVALFRLAMQPNNLEQHKILLDFLWELEPNQYAEYHTFMTAKLHLTTQELLSGFGFDFDRFRVVPIYQALELVISHFSSINSNQAHVVYFLENVFEFSNSNGTTFSAYMRYWDLHSENLNVAMPEGMEAVQIMTIHQAKGLEFPIVILPFLDDLLQPKVNYNIWMPLHSKPFDRFQWGWVSYSRKLSEMNSDADTAYQKEKVENEWDAFTVLYVALTRAVSHLFLISQHTSNLKENKSYAHLLQSFATHEGHEATSGKVLQWGAITPREGIALKSKKHDLTFSTLANAVASDWQNKLIAQFDPDGRAQRTVQERGILIHQLLKEIRYADAVNYVLLEAMEKGWIQEEEQRQFQNLLNQVLTHPILREHFTPRGQIFNEQDILIPGGEILRPDRVVVYTDFTALIDYKTGKPKPQDRVQMERYTQVLETMGHVPVKKYLVYIENEVRVESF